MKINILMSGSSGFVGANLVEYLNLYGVTVNVILRDKLHKIELSDIIGADVIIHLAGKAHDLNQVSSPKEYYDVNYEMTKNLFDQFLCSNASKFIFISSVKAAADSVVGVLDENTIPNPKTHYGKSKLMAEEYIRRQNMPVGKSFFILRPCMIHGPGNKGNLNLLYKFVKKGIPYPLASFENKRSFLSIENLCFVITELIFRSDITSGIYNVADDESLSTNTVVGIISRSLNKKERLWYVPSRIIRFSAKIGDKLNLPLSTERLNKLTESYVVSNDKLKTALGKKLPISAKDGLYLTSISFKHA